MVPQYNFKTIQASDLRTQAFSTLKLSTNTLRLAIGDKLASSEQKISLDGFQTQNSLFSETLVLSKEEVVKSRSLNYQLKLDSSAQTSDKGEKVPDFGGFVTLNFGFSQRIKTPIANSRTVQSLLAGNNRSSFDLGTIDERRTRLPEIFEP